MIFFSRLLVREFTPLSRHDGACSLWLERTRGRAPERSAAGRAAMSSLAAKLAPLGLPASVCDGLSLQLDALLQLDAADDPRARCACREMWPG